jgi:hypothetical protein
MIGKIAAVCFAAVCAAIIVGFISEPAPAIAAETSRTPQSLVKNVVQPAIVTAARSAEVQKPDCEQAWPNYEESCLHDGRRADGRAHEFRVIVLSTSRARQSARMR